MKTPQEIFKNDSSLLQNNLVIELISEYEIVCDALIDIQQVSEMNKEKYLKVLVKEIAESIQMELNRDNEADRFGETENVDFKQAVLNLKNYIQQYCRDYQINL